VEPQSVTQHRVVHIPPGRENPQEQARVGATQRIRDNRGWPNNLQQPLAPPQAQVPYSTGGEEHLWTMNGVPVSEDDDVMINADQYDVPVQNYKDSRKEFETENYDGEDVQSFTEAQDTSVSEPNHDFVAPGGYLLMIKGKIVARGDLGLMNEIVSDIIYDRHPDFKGMSLDPDDFVVLMRMRIRVGVSIE
jgi:hypothetical protein